MNESVRSAFDIAAFLQTTGQRPIRVPAEQPLFLQGDPADSVVYLQSGRAKITAVSKCGREATLAFVAGGDFLGEEAMSGNCRRQTTANTITECMVFRIPRREMARLLHQEPALSDRFLAFLLARGVRAQADLIDQLFNSSEMRLARILLLMANFERHREPRVLIPQISQETLAGMVGTTRARVSFFMNRFRKLGFVEYRNGIVVHRSLANILLADPQVSRDSAPELAKKHRTRTKAHPHLVVPAREAAGHGLSIVAALRA